MIFTPARQRGYEYLDDRSLDPAIAIRSLRDIRRSNALFGGATAVLDELMPRLAALGGAARELSLLDVGTGSGDIPAAARRIASASGLRLRTFGLEWTSAIAAAARPVCGSMIAGDARRLPIADHGVDVVICAQVLHHFADDDARALIAEMHRVARHYVVIGEIRRSWFAAAGIWLASWPLGFHPVSRHDGVTSVFRGFVEDDLRDLVRSATRATPDIRRHAGFRITAAWAVA